MARSYPIRTPRNSPRFNSNHRRLLCRIYPVQLPRNGVDMFRPLRNLEYAVRLPVHSWLEIATSELGISRWVQRYLVLALSVSQHISFRARADEQCIIPPNSDL